MKTTIRYLCIILLFCVGLGVLLYPTVSDLLNRRSNASLIDTYATTASQIDPADKARIFEEAHTYNACFKDKDALDASGLIYENILNCYGNGVMGYLEIPKISVSLAIYHSVGEEFLRNGVGHMKGTSVPVGGDGTHAVLAGHRGLPSAKLFTDLDQMEPGDVFYIHVLDETFQYTVDEISVVEPKDVSQISIEEGEDYVTLVTCTPYGINSHRLLVRGTRSATP